jgi:hypothetical protein
MGDWGIDRSHSFITPIGIDTATSKGTTIVGHDNAHTKGSWVQLSAAITFDASGIIINIPWTDTYSYLVDIGIGGEGSELVLISNILSHCNSDNAKTRGQKGSYFFPVHIPKGTRVSARCQSSVGAKSLEVILYLVSGGFTSNAPYNIVSTFGDTAASTTGTAVDPGGSANTKGSWVQFSASCSFALREVIIAVTASGNSYGRLLMDIGIGGGGSEVVIISNWAIYHQYDSQTRYPCVSPLLPFSVPAGSRIAVRCQNDNIDDATNRVLGVILYGVS